VYEMDQAVDSKGRIMHIQMDDNGVTNLK